MDYAFSNRRLLFIVPDDDFVIPDHTFMGMALSHPTTDRFMRCFYKHKRDIVTDEARINLYVDPLGTLTVKWIIPVGICGKKIKMRLPSFKYDLPKVGGLPVPLSSKAISLQIKDIKANLPSEDYKLKLKHKPLGNYVLFIRLLKVNQEFVQITYKIPSIVNDDTIYYVIVYPLLNPFDSSVTFNIDFRARFSFKIRKYKFREWYFNSKTGERVTKNQISKSNKVGDLISVSFSKLRLAKNEELDIHLTGTRFPFMLRRDIFWSILFMLSLLILTSPLWSALLNE